jgi:methylene-tetrahydromethanopterin dehydrogenase
VQVLNASVLEDARELKVAADINARPPAGIEGMNPKDDGAPTRYASAAGAVSVGPLTIGKVKVRTQQNLLRSMLATEKPIYLDFGQAFHIARELVET